MNEHRSITAPLDAATLARVEEMAGALGISGPEFAALAIREATTGATDFATFVQAGVASAERGELLTQEQVEAWFEERVAARRRG